jgi:predicted transcriptional regulator of viral defense system
MRGKYMDRAATTSPISDDLSSEAALNKLQAQARYYFQVSEFANLTNRGVGSAAVKMALYRLVKRNRIVAITRRPSAYLIISPEQASYGSPPFSWWIDDCMRYIEPSYYVGLLTAAKHWGSAHYARQDVQLVVSRARPSLTPGRLKLNFYPKRYLERTPTVMVSTGVAPWKVSTRAATVLDLIRHQKLVGGLEAIVRVLKDLSAQITAIELRSALEALDQRSAAQRFGFLLDRINRHKLAEVVHEWLGNTGHHVPQSLELGTETPGKLVQDSRWYISFDQRRVDLALEA